jgi:hypothetical protein
MVPKIIIAVAITFGVGVLLYSLGWTLWHYRYALPWIADSTDPLRVHLLCETDHEVLLQACNELSRRAKRGELKPGTYNVRRDHHPQVRRFPQPIRDLVPGYVYIDENDSGRVMLAMQGGLDHFGVQAYRHILRITRSRLLLDSRLETESLFPDCGITMMDT